MDEKKKLMEELRQMAYGEASDASGAELKSAAKLRAIELLGKLCGVFEDDAKPSAGVIIVEDV